MDKIKFSDLLLLGAKRVHQCTDNYTELGHTNQVESACAIGMMAVGKSGSLDHEEVDMQVGEICRQMRHITNLALNTRFGRPDTWALDACVVHANDELGMSPDQIAELLREYGY